MAHDTLRRALHDRRAFLAALSAGGGAAIAGRPVLAGGAEDMAAAYLNRTSGEKAGVETVAASNFATLLQAAFEATPMLVRALSNAENAPKNKISNIK